VIEQGFEGAEQLAALSARQRADFRMAMWYAAAVAAYAFWIVCMEERRATAEELAHEQCIWKLAHSTDDLDLRVHFLEAKAGLGQPDPDAPQPATD